MPRIVKYELRSENPEEVEFEVTKVTQTTDVAEVTDTTDEYGNPISARRRPDVKVDRQVREGIKAVSLPSRTPAKVIILETDEGVTEAGRERQAAENQVEGRNLVFNKDTRDVINQGGRPRNINLTQSMYGGQSGGSESTDTSPGQVHWAD